MQKIDNVSWIQHEPGQIDNVERTCLSKKICLSSPQFDQTPQQLFKVREKRSCLHKFCPWAYSRLDQPREERKTRKPDSFVSLDHPPLHPVEPQDGAPMSPLPKYIPQGGGPWLQRKEGSCSLSADKLPTNRTSLRGCFSYQMTKASNLQSEYGLKNGIFGEGASPASL